MRAAYFSSPGPCRSKNEDGLYLGEIIVDRDMLAPEFGEIQSRALVAVADGLGGGPGGREAAFIVLTKLSELALLPFSFDAQNLVAQNLKNAALALSMVAKRNPDLKQMGSALAGLWFEGERALAFNCGDCRVYRIRAGFFELLTQDHSLVYELYAHGQIAEEAMAEHPLKNILTSSIQDGSEEPRIFFQEFAFSQGDAFLLCSDGVWEAASRTELENLAAESQPEAARQLARALSKKALDNISFIWLY